MASSQNYSMVYVTHLSQLQMEGNRSALVAMHHSLFLYVHSVMLQQAPSMGQHDVKLDPEASTRMPLIPKGHIANLQGAVAMVT